MDDSRLAVEEMRPGQVDGGTKRASSAVAKGMTISELMKEMMDVDEARKVVATLNDSLAKAFVGPYKIPTIKKCVTAEAASKEGGSSKAAGSEEGGISEAAGSEEGSSLMSKTVESRPAAVEMIPTQVDGFARGTKRASSAVGKGVTMSELMKEMMDVDEAVKVVAKVFGGPGPDKIPRFKPEAGSRERGSYKAAESEDGGSSKAAGSEEEGSFMSKTVESRPAAVEMIPAQVDGGADSTKRASSAVGKGVTMSELMKEMMDLDEARKVVATLNVNLAKVLGGPDKIPRSTLQKGNKVEAGSTEGGSSKAARSEEGGRPDVQDGGEQSCCSGDDSCSGR